MASCIELSIHLVRMLKVSNETGLTVTDLRPIRQFCQLFFADLDPSLG